MKNMFKFMLLASLCIISSCGEKENDTGVIFSDNCFKTNYSMNGKFVKEIKAVCNKNGKIWNVKIEMIADSKDDNIIPQRPKNKIKERNNESGDLEEVNRFLNMSNGVNPSHPLAGIIMMNP